MPRGAFPPTPASSTEIKGQDGLKQLASLQVAFELPPPALYGRVSPTASDTDIPMLTHSHGPDMLPPSTSATSPSSGVAYPMQAAEAVKSRRRSSVLQAQAPANAHTSPSGKDAYSLPPPPARSRKIIQMKPRTAARSGGPEKAGDSKDKAGTATPSSAGKPGKGAAAAATAAPTAAGASTGATDAAGTKKKQPAPASAAGRKVARKTAHSLIERRRRSKMNEEFAVLKGMIPACTGEMHKLAILQASIEYVRYLENCVATLKAQREGEQQLANYSCLSPRAMPQHGSHSPRYASRICMDEDAVSSDVAMAGTGGHEEEGEKSLGGEEDGDDDDDEEDSKGDSDAGRHQASVSPALPTHAQQSHQYHDNNYRPQNDARHNSHSSNASSTRYSSNISAADHNAQLQQRHQYSSFSYTSGGGLGGFTTSAQTSPAFGPQQHPLPPLPPSAAASPLLYGPSLSAAATHGGTSSTGPSISGSALTSPALAPQRDMDQEATAALLMLNSDRRGTRDSISSASGNTAGRGMSVQDLLST